LYTENQPVRKSASKHFINQNEKGGQQRKLPRASTIFTITVSFRQGCVGEKIWRLAGDNYSFKVWPDATTTDPIRSDQIRSIRSDQGILGPL